MEIVKTKVELMDNKPYEAILDKIETAGRNCYKTQVKRDIAEKEKFIRRSISWEHESIIEHECLTFKITTDRAIANEIVRHRLSSYSQESSRYVNVSNMKVVLPLKAEDKYTTNKILDCYRECEKTYRDLLENGVKRDVARSVLPLGMATDIIMTMNFRSLRHFLKLRLDKSAHENIREVARQIYDILKEKYPVFVEDLEELRWQK